MLTTSDSKRLVFPSEVTVIVNKCSAAVTLIWGIKPTVKFLVMLLSTALTTEGDVIVHLGFRTDTSTV